MGAQTHTYGLNKEREKICSKRNVQIVNVQIVRVIHGRFCRLATVDTGEHIFREPTWSIGKTEWSKECKHGSRNERSVIHEKLQAMILVIQGRDRSVGLPNSASGEPAALWQLSAATCLPLASGPYTASSTQTYSAQQSRARLLNALTWQPVTARDRVVVTCSTLFYLTLFISLTLLVSP